LHEYKVAIHTQQRLTVDLLVLEDLAVLLLYAHFFQVLGYAGRRPCLDFFLGVPILLFFVSFLAIDVR